MILLKNLFSNGQALSISSKVISNSHGQNKIASFQIQELITQRSVSSFKRYNHAPFPEVPLLNPSHYNIIAKPKDEVAKVFNLDNKQVGEVSLPWKIFKAPLRKDVLHRVVVWQQAKTRQGTKSTLSKSEVSGSRKKRAPQKGQGSARQGTHRAPQFRHGGRAFPVKPRSFEYDLPKKVRWMGLRVALSTKLAQGKLVIVDNFSMETFKTSDFVEIMKKFGWRKALLVDGSKKDQNLTLAARKLFWNVQVLPQCGINVYSILSKEHLVITREALDYIINKYMHDPPSQSNDSTVESS